MLYLQFPKGILHGMKNIVTYIILSILCTASSIAQNNMLKIGSHEITGDINISQLVAKHIEFNERVQTIPGYRICIAKVSGSNSKNQAFGIKNKFASEHKDVNTYLVFDEPNFVVKVGDFRTRMDAFAYLQKIKGTYKGTIIKDNIYPTEVEQEELVPETDDDANE